MPALALLTEDAAFFFLTEDGAYFIQLETGEGSITPLRPIARQQGVQIPHLLSAPDWCNATTLAPGVAHAFTPPTDSAGNLATIFRINSTDSPLYLNFNGTAVAPTVNVTNGSASIIVHSKRHPAIIAAPVATDTLSVLCASAATVTVEAWS
jgi:hypothetical protein